MRNYQESTRAPGVSGLLIIATVLMQSGCAVWLNGREAGDDSPGYRYYLPQPALQVTPQSDGSVKVDVVYLPDPAKAYNLQAGSFLAAYKLDVKTDDKGLLEAVTFNPNASAVAAESAKAAGEIAKARFDAIKEERKAETTAADQARSARLDAEKKVAAAQAKVDELERQGNSANLPEAMVALEQAKAELRVLLLGGLPDAGSANNVAGGDSAPVFPQAWGPVLYLIKQEQVNWPLGSSDQQRTTQVPAVRLVALAEQRPFDTSTLATVPETTSKLSLEPNMLQRQGSDPLLLRLTGEPSLPDPTDIAVVKASDPTGQRFQVQQQRINPKTLAITLPTNLAPGGYALRVEMPDENASDLLTFTVQ